MTRKSTRAPSLAGGIGRSRPDPGVSSAKDPSPPPEAGKLAPGLYLVATPIGNLEDLSRRAERILATADVVACEDRRVTGRLLAHLGLRRPLALYHEHNAEAARPGLLARLAAGASVALASDAGTPTISDPGFKLVREARAQGAAVYPIPGPSAALAALVASGLPTDRFLFAGFLPPRAPRAGARSRNWRPRRRRWCSTIAAAAGGMSRRCGGGHGRAAGERGAGDDQAARGAPAGQPRRAR
ncbi:MAG: ribosomal RNA small subunit methyltransferase I [Geminicoccaceae bacterium]